MRKKDTRIKRSLFSAWSFLVFFAVIAFFVTACFLLFLKGFDFAEEEIRYRAVMTFGNVLLLSLLCTVIDSLRRKLMVERPVTYILEAARRIAQGDFSARIEPIHGADSRNEFDIIIEDFNKMAEELSGIETLRTDFIANVSHELKTPLAVIQNYAVLLQEPGLAEEKRMEYAKDITETTRRFSDLITNILKLNKLENQQIFPQAAEYNLGEQLCECLLSFEDAWEKKNLDIVCEIEEDVLIHADWELLTIVWNNLFSNAVKFTDEGGRITVRLKQEGDMAAVEVSDTGCGIPPETGKQIFEKFYQGDTSRATQGNGLGLALVRRVVDIMNGEISVESRVGTGSAFTVRIRRNADRET